MKPTESKSHKLVETLKEAEDDLYGVVRGFLPGNDVDKNIAENLRIKVYDLMKLMQHYYYPDEEPTWDYDENNTFVESGMSGRGGFNLCHSDGTVLATFDLRGIHQGYEVVNVHLNVPFLNNDPRSVAMLVHQHVKDVVRPQLD